MPNSSSRPSNSLWRPLRSPTFRNLLTANVVSDIGTFMQSVGAAWLMVSLNAGPMYVALIQTASALPFFVLALPAGAVGDILDRRRIILSTETWMIAVAFLLAGLTLAGLMSPLLLLILTFALSAGDAFESPTWRAVLPELVEKEDLPAASALNGIEFNFARAIGPALAGAVVAFAGVGIAFLINAVSFVGVILVVLRWKRPVLKRATPPETVAGATRAAIRYVRYSPGVLRVLVRSGTGMFFASALLALLPSLAHRISGSPVGYGVLLGGFGAGAVLGALVLQRARDRWSTDVIVSVGIAAFGLVTMASECLTFGSLGAVMVVGPPPRGAAWVDTPVGQNNGHDGTGRRRPGMITAWNAKRAVHVCLKLASAIAAGCTVVHQAKRDELAAIARVLNRGSARGGPPGRGVLNVVTGLGATVGAELVRNPDVDKISFTGSVGVGGRVSCGTAPATMKRVTLELGGKSPTILLDDAALDQARFPAKTLVMAFMNSGQACAAGTRLLVPKSRLAEIKRAIVKTMPAFPRWGTRPTQEPPSDLW